MKKNNEFPGIDEVRSSVNDKDRTKTVLLGLFHLSLPLFVWMTSFAGVIFAPWWAKIFFGYANGHALGVTILIGHDALHGT